MAPRLHILTGSRAGASVPLGEQPVTFGRRPDRTLVFAPEEILVSAEHASIEVRAGFYVLRDLDSTNGTYVNGERVRERVLEEGDVIQFGAGGPAARFELQPADVSPTLDTGLLVPRRTQPSQPAPAAGIGRRSTRELMALTLDRFAVRTRRVVVGAALAAVLVIAGFALWQQWTRAQLERALLRLSVSLTAERASRAILERDLGAVEARYDSLRKLVAEQRRAAPEGRAGRGGLREYSQGVALIVFSFGYVEQDGTELLRYVVDARGEVIGPRAPDGQLIPAIRFGGDGPPVTHEGTASGFLVDSAGLILTNRHVAEPWSYGSDELDNMRAHGIAARGRLLDLRAYFPPGDESFRLAVETTSPRADVAIMRVLGGRVHAPVLPLAAASAAVQPGDHLRLIGYPTGVYNLLFRVDDATRNEILARVGDDSRRLVDELARRRLIQPLVTDGGVSDTTGTEVIHTAATTVGGSGGPLLDERQLVVAIQHASVVSPSRGDPFRTQRAVPIRFAWQILPRKTASRR